MRIGHYTHYTAWHYEKICSGPNIYSNDVEKLKTVSIEDLKANIDPILCNVLAFISLNESERRRLKCSNSKWDEHYTDFVDSDYAYKQRIVGPPASCPTCQYSYPKTLNDIMTSHCDITSYNIIWHDKVNLHRSTHMKIQKITFFNPATLTYDLDLRTHLRLPEWTLQMTGTMYYIYHTLKQGFCVNLDGISSKFCCIWPFCTRIG